MTQRCAFTLLRVVLIHPSFHLPLPQREINKEIVSIERIINLQQLFISFIGTRAQGRVMLSEWCVCLFLALFINFIGKIRKTILIVRKAGLGLGFVMECMINVLVVD